MMIDLVQGIRSRHNLQLLSFYLNMRPVNEAFSIKNKKS